MAKRQKDLGDWKILLEEPETGPLTPSRRSRRTRPSTENDVKISRESDGLQIQTGDAVLLSTDGQKGTIAVIVSVELGVKQFLEVKVAPFVRLSDVSIEHLPKDNSTIEKNEVFLTTELDLIRVADVVDKVQILSESEFSEIVMDDSSASSLYLCRRACDSFGERFSDVFDFRDWHKLALQNLQHAIAFVAEQTLIIISPNKAKAQSKSLQNRLTTSSPLRKRYREVSDDSDEDAEVDSDSEDDDEESDEEEEEEEVVKTPRKKREPKTESNRSGSPRKRGRPPQNTDDIKHLRKVLPNNFKVKGGAAISNLPSLSGSSPQKGMSDASSEAFTKLKEKLHTSTKIASLPCREDEFTSIYLNLETAIKEEAGCCIYVSGTPGVGKTATIREVVRELKDISSQGLLNDFDFLEINCLKLLTPYSAYEKLWQHIYNRKVTPANAALLLEKYFNDDGTEFPESFPRKPLVVLMDELDQIVTKTQNVMYNFFNWPTIVRSKLIVIAVANTMDLPERVLSNKISSRLGLRRIQFVGYTFEQLGTIIAHRLEMLTKQDRRKVTVSADAAGFASRKVASVSGDARRALAICRRAVEIAEEEYLQTAKDVPEEEQAYSIQLKHISAAINETTNSPISQVLTSLSFASKLVLVAVLLRTRRSGLAENTLGDIMDEMKNSLKLLTTKESTQALKPISPTATYMDLLYGNNVRMFAMSHIVNELVEHGILVQQNIRSERYRLINLNVSEDEVLTVLRKDTDIGGLL